MTHQLRLPQKLEQKLEWQPITFIDLTTLLLAIFALSSAAIFIRLNEESLGPNSTIFNRFWVGAIVLGVGQVITMRRQPPAVAPQPFTGQTLLLLIAMSCTFVGTLLMWAWSLTQTGVANSNLFHNVTPLFTTIGGWLFLRQRFDNRFLVGMALALGGAGLIAAQDWQVSGEHFVGDAAAIGSAVLSAANLMLVEHLRTRFSASTILLWCSAIGSVLTLPIVLLTGEPVFPNSGSGWICVIAMSVICQVIGQSLQAHNLKRFSAGFVAVFLLLDPILTAIFAWIIFAEQISVASGLAFGLVLIGIYLAKSSQGIDKERQDDALLNLTSELASPSLKG
ncbi:MAG: DMT family transporter [Myxacorys chilensis ATA2-1-KO14]|jgi:drug/metabolite transporter (DMT)-like permease|nr:DMT family transporter [Myxacorys chilensis ATA2-1-KO14]